MYIVISHHGHPLGSTVYVCITMFIGRINHRKLHNWPTFPCVNTIFDIVYSSRQGLLHSALCARASVPLFSCVFHYLMNAPTNIIFIFWCTTQGAITSTKLRSIFHVNGIKYHRTVAMLIAIQWTANWVIVDIDGLVEDSNSFSAFAKELGQSCDKPSIPW